ncbi:CHASE2 domain-containing protein [Butyrivibrio sp. XPD2002]|uniref:CHASE2 domain-containing protein n=1 Tax=Butyrivibrio sp. XPD2002 TaxID=1280665 RepID=UPI00040914E9|nr:adenylate/guanylate cyclase domain-containing protein [Butyrivibrio sp. XPD2002]
MKCLKSKKKIIISIAAMTVAVLFVFMANSGLLNYADGVVSDAVYQKQKATDGEIVVVGIDQKALQEIGPLPWSRDIMADVISILNSGEEKPAVIAVDVLYVGESASPENDSYLANVADFGENVVTASAATYGSGIVEIGDNFYVEKRKVLAYDEPFPELAKVTNTGHINTMADSDGIIRHALLAIDVPGKGTVKSFSRTIYEKYCEVKGIAVNPEPPTIKGFFYIPFTGKGGAYYDFISASDIYYGEVDPDFFAGKIVLIGPYAAGLQDEYRTSIDHAAPTYGIEIHANLVEAFRNGFYPIEASKALQLVLLFFITFVMFIFFYDRKVLHSVVGEIIVCLGTILLAYLLYHTGGIVLHVLWIPLFVSILFVVSIAINYIKTSNEKRKVADTFGHYVDPVIMKQLLEQGTSALELGGKMHDIAVLFVDIRGFTTMSESLDPPTVVEIINSYLTLTTECIMKNHGTLDKFVGDCTMAFWNAPLSQEDPVYLACCAAMDMVEGSKALGEQLLEKYGRTVSFGIGVNWGPAVVGNIGAPRRMDYTAIGDTVNTSARLEANAPGGKILISRAVADILGDRAKVTSLGNSIKLKGKADGFEILTLDELIRK